jgi:acyl-coenzyme A synthetase/AMP-(fatty) acid ligase
MGVVQIWAAIVSATPVDMAALQALCRAKLADKAPKFILQIKGLPRNANGKIVRTELVRFASQRQP